MIDWDSPLTVRDVAVPAANFVHHAVWSGWKRVRRCLWEIPNLHHHQTHQTAAQEQDQEQGEVAHPLMASEPSVGCFDLEALLISFGGTRHVAVTLERWIKFHRPRVREETAHITPSTERSGQNGVLLR